MLNHKGIMSHLSWAIVTWPRGTPGFLCQIDTGQEWWRELGQKCLFLGFNRVLETKRPGIAARPFAGFFAET
jgi:hypothetical protein